MKEYCNAIDALPLIVKIIIALIPALNLVWLLYVIFNAVSEQKWLGLILDIVLYCCFIWWLLNLIWICIYNRPFTVSAYLK